MLSLASLPVQRRLGTGGYASTTHGRELAYAVGVLMPGKRGSRGT